MSDDPIILCPYCGNRQRFASGCGACGGRFDAWSLAATQNDMGAWFVRDSKRPHFVGCSYEAMVAAIHAGEIGRDAIVRGPSTRQFWTVARRAAGLAHLFGRCHACQGPVNAELPECGTCGSGPLSWQDRNYLGLPTPETLAPPSEPLTPEALVATAFAREGNVYFVRVAPVPPPATAIVRVTPPASTLAPASIPIPTPTPTPVATPSPLPAPTAAPESRPGGNGLSAIDRSLAERVRRLERTNRALFFATVFTTVVALLLSGAYVAQRDARTKELAAAREEAVRGVRAEFARTQPVTRQPEPEVPAEPQPPAAKSPPAQPRSPGAAPR